MKPKATNLTIARNQQTIFVLLYDRQKYETLSFNAIENAMTRWRRVVVVVVVVVVVAVVIVVVVVAVVPLRQQATRD